MTTMDMVVSDVDRAWDMMRSGDLTFDDIRIMDGNRKTGRSVYTLSLLPVLDCCQWACRGDCYDLLHDVIKSGCRWARAVNHVLHCESPWTYWETAFEKFGEISRKHDESKERSALRINVGGDVSALDLAFIETMTRRFCPKSAKVLLFTKCYDGLLRYLRDRGVGAWDRRIHVVVSRWPGLACPSQDIAGAAPRGFHYIESYVLWGDRVPKNVDRLDPEAMSGLAEYEKSAKSMYRCGGDCGYCLGNGTGCFSRRLRGVSFEAH